MKIMWRNKYSQETGFVKCIRKEYFENGTVEEARKFRSMKDCNKAIEQLNSIGEGENNDFIVTDLNGVAVA